MADWYFTHLESNWMQIEIKLLIYNACESIFFYPGSLSDGWIQIQIKPNNYDLLKMSCHRVYSLIFWITCWSKDIDMIINRHAVRKHCDFWTGRLEWVVELKVFDFIGIVNAMDVNRFKNIWEELYERHTGVNWARIHGKKNLVFKTKIG